MAQFKIDLLTPSVVETTNNEFNFSTPYLVTRISEFYKQTDEFNSKQTDELSNIAWTQQQNTYTFTFDEKVSFHKNAQKELTFSMLRNVWVENEFVVNPFVSALHVGAQLLLTDKDGNEHIFTVKNVNYTPTSENMLYAYTCQDSFSYQGARQNAGYTIENDLTSEDFIGAENIDFWAKKIQQECHIGYKYLGLKDNLWIGQDGNTHTGAISSLNKIIKHAYNEIDHKDYFATIPFSVSGSSASAALISLAEQMGFMLNVCEKTQTGEDGRIYIDSYFWLEPEKHEQVSGLKYSPYSSIQNFTFSHAGESLSTVLNVESNTFDDELVTLLPDVQEFFIEYFESDEWKNSSFYEGMFSDVCQGKIFKSNGNIGSDFDIGTKIYGKEEEEGESFLYLEIKNLKIPQFYKNLKFEDSFKESELYLNTDRHTPYLSQWDFGYIIQGDIKDSDETIIITPAGRPVPQNSFRFIKEQWVYEEKIYKKTATSGTLNAQLKTTTTLYYPKLVLLSGEDSVKDIPTDENTIYALRIKPLQNSTDLDIAHLDLIFNFYRNATQDELDFAEIADKCPWLENKLIDFSYFLENKIINKKEYNSLQNIVKNTLRKVNGQLLAYTKAYYQATKKKVETLAGITNSIDSIGAAFQSDVIDKYAVDGSVESIDYFLTAYEQWSQTKKEKDLLLNLNSILADYANKYIKAQQRFLKNIYNFKQFFNAPVNWNGRESIIYPKTITTSKKENNDTLIYFSNSPFEEFNDSVELDSRTIYNSDLTTETEYVKNNNYENYYVLPSDEQDYTIETGKYNSNRQYFRKMLIIDLETGEPIPETLERSGSIFYLDHSDGDRAYYILPGHPSFNNEDFQDISTVILPVTESDIMAEYLYVEGVTDLIQKDENLYSNVFISNSDIYKIREGFGDQLKRETLWGEKIEDLSKDDFRDKYTARFPIDALYLRNHPSYIWDGKENRWEQEKDANNNTVFKNYTLPFVKSSNYENFYCRTNVVTWVWKNQVPWRTGGGLCAGNWDWSEDFYFETGFANLDKGTIYAPASDSYKTFKNYFDKNTAGDYPKFYDTYYKFKAEHYKSARSAVNKDNVGYEYKDKKCQILGKNNKISKQLSYKILPIGDKGIKLETLREYISDSKFFSSIVLHPFMEFATDVNTSIIDWGDRTECEVSELLHALTGIESWDTDLLNDVWNDQLLILLEQDYDRVPLTWSSWGDLKEKISKKSIFNDSMIEYNHESVAPFANNFYFKTEDGDLVKASEFNEDSHYYKEDRTRVYTASQLQKMGGTYLPKNDDSITTNSYSNTETIFNANVSIYADKKIINIGPMAVMLKDNDTTIVIEDKKSGIKYECNVQVSNENEIDLTDKTNAFVWSQYHDKTDSPLFEDAARIETQLEEYWLQAYNASKYCEYFLPEHWQPSVGGKTNHFSRMVFNPDTLEINSSIVPQVEMIKKDGSTLLPKYNYTIKPGAGDKSLPKICGENEALKSAFDVLEISGDNTWAGQPLNITTTYYKAKNNSGTKWRDVLSTLSSGSMSLEHFDGIYPMTFKFLRDNFEEQQLVDYEAALGEHNRIWDNLYKFFPGIILETTYSNPDATTSQDLFTLARNHFKDLSKPERGYSISVIDAASLSGYKGQELRIGDAIQLDAEEFYDEYDAIKKTLSQYLFITDISYDLRKDSDIQLTVNSIKYQEKLIQRLVKLIK